MWGGTNVIGCVPNLSDQASFPLIINTGCSDLYQQLVHIKGSIQLLCAVGGPSVLLMALISSPDMSEKTGKPREEQVLGP